MLKINQIIRCTIKTVQEDSGAIIFVNKDKVKVANVLPNEEVDIKIIKKLKDFYIGDVVKIIKPHDSRVKADCSIYNICGSCHLLHVQSKEQLNLKRQALIKLMKGTNLSLHIKDVIGMEQPYAYRNKMIIGFAKDKNRKIQAGFYEEYSHRIIPYTSCLLHDPTCDAIVQTIVTLMEKLRIEPYDEDKRRGMLRHVLIRKATKTKEIMVVLVVNQQVFPARKNFVSALLKQFPMITTVIQNVNTRKTSVVLGDEERVLYGPGFIEDDLCGLRFRISAKSFYQINHDQCEVLYKTAIDQLKLTGQEVVIDAYCGIGTIGLYISTFVKQVIGVEVNKAAIKDAIDNAKHNRIKNIRFVCDDAGSFMRKLAAKNEKIDAVIMDPPRSGSDEKFMDAIAVLKPKQIIYISCNPETQIRDLQYFRKLGYQTDEMIPVDMFPNTKHVESIVKLTRTK